MVLATGKFLQNGKYVLGPVAIQRKLTVTYRATYAPSNQPVEILAARETLQGHPDFKRLQQHLAADAQRLAQCQHPNLVKVLDFFEEDGLCFLVLEQIQGHSLQEVVTSVGPLPEEMAVHYIRQVGLALMALQQQHLFHQDVQPGNIIRRLKSDVVVLTHLPGPGEISHNVSPNPYTLPGSDRLGRDIYGLAATLYYLLMGQPPILPNDPIQDRATAALPDPIALTTQLRQFQPGLSLMTEQAIIRGLTTQPQQRPETVEDWLALLPRNQPVQVPTPPLRSTTQPVTTSKPAPKPTKSDRLPRILLLSGAVAACLGLGGGLAIRLSWMDGTGPSLFKTEQSFPKRNWPGTVPQDPATENVSGSQTPASTRSGDRPRYEESVAEPAPAEPVEQPLPTRRRRVTPAQLEVPKTPTTSSPIAPTPQPSAPSPAANPQPPQDTAPPSAPVPSAPVAPEPVAPEPLPSAPVAPEPIAPPASDPAPPPSEPAPPVNAPASSSSPAESESAR